MKLSALFLGLVLSLGTAAHAQDLALPTQDPLAELPPIAMALEVAKHCGAKPGRFPELVKFKRLAVESYVKLSQGNAADVEAAFKKGEAEGRKLKADMPPARCRAALTEMEQLNEVFKQTNGTIEKLMQYLAADPAGAQTKPAPAGAPAKK